MSDPLALIGGAVLEVIGLNPTSFDNEAEGNIASSNIFGEKPFHQPTGMGNETETVHLATRPHIMGGLGTVEILKAHRDAQDVVPFIRLNGSVIGAFKGMVIVKKVSTEEKNIAPGGMGWRWEFTVELLYVGENAGGLFG